MVLEQALSAVEPNLTDGRTGRHGMAGAPGFTRGSTDPRACGLVSRGETVLALAIKKPEPPMIVEMPFFQKSTGRSPSRSDVRELVSFDKDVMDLPEFSLSDLDPGADVGNDMRTLIKEGRHWAYFGTAVTGASTTAKDADGRERAMRDLSNMIDTTRSAAG